MFLEAASTALAGSKAPEDKANLGKKKLTGQMPMGLSEAGSWKTLRKLWRWAFDPGHVENWSRSPERWVWSSANNRWSGSLIYRAGLMLPTALDQVIHPTRGLRGRYDRLFICLSVAYWCQYHVGLEGKVIRSDYYSTGRDADF